MEPAKIDYFVFLYVRIDISLTVIIQSICILSVDFILYFKAYYCYLSYTFRHITAISQCHAFDI